MSANPMGMDVYILSQEGDGKGLSYRKYDAIDARTDLGVITPPSEADDLGGQAREGEFFKRFAYVLYYGTQFHSLAIAVEIANAEDIAAYSEKKKPRSKTEFTPFVRSSEQLSRKPTQEEVALAAFFEAAREAIKIDGFVDMRVYPPVARRDFTA